ncbi:MAG: carboxypeptidase-like regulatory domain-containing protein, partial [Parabacteroides sp.]
MIIKLVILTCLLMCGIFSLAQNESFKYALQGRITDRSSGESLSRASIYIVEQKIGTVADDEGNYSLFIKEPGIYTVQISHIGFENRTLRVPVSGSHTLDIDLNSNAFLKEIIVTGKNSSDNIARPNLGV